MGPSSLTKIVRVEAGWYLRRRILPGAGVVLAELKVMVRESPTRQSLGQVTISEKGLADCDDTSAQVTFRADGHCDATSEACGLTITGDPDFEFFDVFTD